MSKWKISNIIPKLVLLAVLLASNSLYSQYLNEKHLKELLEARTLGEHLFTPHNIVAAPFIITNIRTTVGMGEISNIKTLLLEIGNLDLRYTQGDVLAALLGLEYQHEVKSWLAVNLRFFMIARLGTNINTAVTHGINYARSFNIGWLIKIYRNKNVYISSAFGVTNGDFSFISLNNFINDIINEIPNPSLVKSNNSLLGTMGIRGAYGLNKLVGFNALIEIGYGETIQRELDNKLYANLGINADLNFSHLIKTPLSLSLGYFFSSYPRGSGGNIFNNNIFLSQINYIGRSDLVLSLDLQYSKELYTYDGSTIWYKSMSFSMRYLF